MHFGRPDVLLMKRAPTLGHVT